MAMLIANLILLLVCSSVLCEGRGKSPKDELVRIRVKKIETREEIYMQGTHKRHHGSFISSETTTKRIPTTKFTKATTTSRASTTKLVSCTISITTPASMVIIQPVVVLTKNTNDNSAEHDWDEKLAWRLPFGDPRRPFPATTNEYKNFCEMQQDITEDAEVKFYTSLYPGNKVVQKIGSIFAKVAEDFIKKTCTADIFKRASSISQIGFSANVGARLSKIHRDALFENFMFYSSYPEESKMSTLTCVLGVWSQKTLAKYPDEYYLREYIIASVGNLVREVIKVLQQGTNTSADTECELNLLTRKSKGKAPKSLQLLVMKAVDSLTKNHNNLDK